MNERYAILGQFGPNALAYMAADDNASPELVVEIMKTLEPLVGPDDMVAMINSAGRNHGAISRLINEANVDFIPAK